MMFFNSLQLVLGLLVLFYMPFKIWKTLRSRPVKSQFDGNVYAILAGFSICELVMHPDSRVSFGALSLMMVLCLWLVGSPWVRQREQEALTRTKMIQNSSAANPQ
jgi:threonine/homoserine/homoserine lactone efflux protein